MNTNLHNIQQQLLEILQKDSTSLKDFIVFDSDLDFHSRVNIYVESYFIRLYNALAENYPLLFKWVSDEEFTKLAHEYIQKYPSTHYNLQYYGHRLTEYLEQSLFPSHLHEISKLDWALLNSYRALNQKTLDINEFSSLAKDNGDEFSVELSSNVFIIKFNYNIIQKFIDHKTPLNKLLETNYTIVWRKENQSMYRIVSHHEYNLLNKLIEPINFAELWEMLNTDDNNPWG